MSNDTHAHGGIDPEQHSAAEAAAAEASPAAEPTAAAASEAPGPADAADFTVDDILGAPRHPAAAEADAADASDAAAADAGAADVAGGSPEHEYLEDLRRITAEYANYRKRTEANAAIEKQRAVAAAVTPLLSVLDDLDRAEKHGDLEEGSAFATIAQKLRGTMQRFGLTSYGEVGDVFDPQLHEAIAQVPVPGTEQETVLDVIERGYRLGDVELRPAKVAVAVAADG